MNASLTLLRKNGAHRTFPLLGSVTVIGRQHDCDLRIPLLTVSRKHCRLSWNEDSVKLLDLGSRGGTFVNDKRVDPDKEIAVKAGDYIRIGPLMFLCQIDGRPEKITPPPKAVPKARPEPQQAAAKPAEDDDLADLDVSDSFINLDESDSDLEDLKDL